MNRNIKQEFIVLSANLENKTFIIKNDEKAIKFLNRNKDKESIKEIKRRAKLFEKNIAKKDFK